MASASSAGGASSRLSGGGDDAPPPIGFVRTRASPGRRRRCVSTRPGSTVPMTARPYFGSASSIEWPPTTRTPARGQRRRRREDPRRSFEGRGPPGPGHEVERHERSGAHRVDVRQGVGRGDPSEVVGVVDDRGEEVGGEDDGQVVARAGRRRRRRRCRAPRGGWGRPVGRAPASSACGPRGGTACRRSRRRGRSG